MKLNCWEVTGCGRQSGGVKAADLGVCPATTDPGLHGAHGGKNAGRACWVVAGTLCGGNIQGTYAHKLHDCWRCGFMNMVQKEEADEDPGFCATRLCIERSMGKRVR